MSKFKNIKTMAGSRLGVAIVAAVSTAVIVGGVGYASIPDGSGTIHGCYKTAGTSHELKVIDSAVTANCPHGYTSLNWNETGPPGPQGPSGLPLAQAAVDGHDSPPIIYSDGPPVGWTSVTEPSTGEYCLYASSSIQADAILQLTMTNGFEGFVTEFGVPGCGSGTHWGVRTENTAGVVTAEDFVAVLIP